MITRVRKLTPSNITALRAMQFETAATYIDFQLSPLGALRAVEEAMANSTGYTHRSLAAVRRKLATAAQRWDVASREDGPELALTPYVTVIR